MSLYLRYRPERFEDLIGQYHIRLTLQNAIENQNIAHAYILTGPRGTGKTTTARILAKYIVDGYDNPQNIQDIIEMDAASNTSVDDVRDLIEKATLSPIFSQNKVYIIDEVHMLSRSAFNALLKTLEEPPKHVYFILATTDIEKVPETVISRCQRFDFMSLSLEEIKEKMRGIAKKEGKSIEEDALNALAFAAEGGMRNAETLLEKILSHTKEGERIDEAFVSRLFGFGQMQDVHTILDAFAAKDREALLAKIQELRESGILESVFMQKLIHATHSRLQEAPDNAILTILQLLIEKSKAYTIHTLPFVSLDIAALSYCEKGEARSITSQPEPVSKAKSASKAPSKEEEKETPPSYPETNEVNIDEQKEKKADASHDLKEVWLSVLNDDNMPSPVRNALKHGIPKLGDANLVVHLPSEFFVTRVTKPEHSATILSVIQKHWSHIQGFDAKLSDEAKEPQPSTSPKESASKPAQNQNHHAPQTQKQAPIKKSAPKKEGQGPSLNDTREVFWDALKEDL